MTFLSLEFFERWYIPYPYDWTKDITSGIPEAHKKLKTTQQLWESYLPLSLALALTQYSII